MNEKIKKLAEQSGFFPVPDETEWDWDYRAENARYEKFVELIVRECAQVCRDQPDIYALKADRDNCAIAIEQHFGIE
jgi:hypothetical protein